MIARPEWFGRPGWALGEAEKARRRTFFRGFVRGLLVGLVVGEILAGLRGCASAPPASGEIRPAEAVIPKEKEINFSYSYVVSDTGSMRPVIWDGDTVRVWPPIIRPWVWGNNLIGKIVIRKNCAWVTNGRIHHYIVAVTPRGAVTAGCNNGELGRGVCEDPGFMARDGSDYDGEVTVEVHQLHPGPQKLHSYQKQ